MRQAIQCEQHDYLEIACMFHYQIKLYFKSCGSVIGVANDLITLNKREYIEIELMKEPNTIQSYPTDNIAMLFVLTKGATFKSVTFTIAR